MSGNPRVWASVINSPGTLENMFTDLFAGTGVESAFTSKPSVNIREAEKEFVIELLTPGYEKSEIKITLAENKLTISGEKAAETEDQKKAYTRREFIAGKFSRTFSLPANANAEEVKAEFKNGILFVSIPKRSEEKKSEKEIVIL